MRVCPACDSPSADRARYCADCGAFLGEPDDRARPTETRRTVTVLFSDIVGSTAIGELLDPETVRVVIGRYFERMRAVIESYGGTVEKFIGDAILAVFGMPEVHEDDAFRAAAAAVGMRDALADLNRSLVIEPGVTLGARTGLNTGEVVAGDGYARQLLVTGDTVNTAARLEQAADAGEILLGEPTWLLVRDRVSGERAADLDLKGKSLPVPTWRLISVHAGHAGARGLRGTQFVGRSTEQERLRDLFDGVVEHEAPAVVTVLGAPGVGKTRLVAELGMAVGPVTVLRGYCPSYGQGITYWPIREMLLGAAGITEGASAEASLARLEALFVDDADHRAVIRPLSSVIGLSTQSVGQDEITWAVRRAFEHIARRQPLIAVIEDLHWATPTLIELLEDVADVVNGRVLIACTARPGLLDAWPAWPAPNGPSTIVVLDGLGSESATAIVAGLDPAGELSVDVVARIVRAAEGNPLFLEQMARMALESGKGSFDIPLTVQAVLAARVDGLPATERTVARNASVAGRSFETPAVVELTPGTASANVGLGLHALTRRDLIAPDSPELTEEDAWRFRHGLIRDAAYAGLRKSDRADLHERYAGWLERVAADRLVEYQGIVGYHLREAYRYRIELRTRLADAAEVGRRAAIHLRAAGRRASDQGDSLAALQLARQALEMPMTDAAAEAELHLEAAIAAGELGQLDEARLQVESAMERATLLDKPGLMARARLARVDIGIADGTLLNADPLTLTESDRAMREAEASGDPMALALAWQTHYSLAYMDGRLDHALDPLRRALHHARQTGDDRFALEIEQNLLTMALVGPTPAPEVVELGVSMLPRVTDYPAVRGDTLRLLAVAEAMVGRSDDARMHAAASVELYQSLGQRSAATNSRADYSWVLRLCGDLVTAEAQLREAFAEAIQLGDRTARSFVACRLAQVLMEVGRLDEAEGFVEEADRVPIVMNRTRVVGARARIHAARGESDATRTAIDALVSMIPDVVYPNIIIDAHVDAAEAFAGIGERRAAAGHLDTAIRLAVAKGNTARAAQMRIIGERIAS